MDFTQGDGTAVPRGFEEMLYVGPDRMREAERAAERTTDLKALDRLETACRIFEGEMIAAWPAVRRLYDARYAGGEGVYSAFAEGGLRASVPEVAEAIQDLRTADGNYGAAMWLLYDRGKEKLGDVLHELSYRSDAEDAIRAYLDYRSRLAEGPRSSAA